MIFLVSSDDILFGFLKNIICFPSYFQLFSHDSLKNSILMFRDSDVVFIDIDLIFIDFHMIFNDSP